MTYEVYMGSEPSDVQFTDSVDADSVSDAAEKYAAQQHAGDPFDSMDLIVIDPDERSWIVTVEAVYSVDFRASVPR